MVSCQSAGPCLRSYWALAASRPLGAGNVALGPSNLISPQMIWGFQRTRGHRPRPHHTPLPEASPLQRRPAWESLSSFGEEVCGQSPLLLLLMRSSKKYIPKMPPLHSQV